VCWSFVSQEAVSSYELTLAEKICQRYSDILHRCLSTRPIDSEHVNL